MLFICINICSLFPTLYLSTCLLCTARRLHWLDVTLFSVLRTTSCRLIIVWRLLVTVQWIYSVSCLLYFVSHVASFASFCNAAWSLLLQNQGILWLIDDCMYSKNVPFSRYSSNNSGQSMVLVNRASAYCKGDIFTGWVKRTILYLVPRLYLLLHRSAKRSLQHGLMMWAYFLWSYHAPI